MGVQIAEILPKKEIQLVELSGKKIAIDAFNTIFQFLSIIRDRFTGEPLKDSQGQVTSHLSGLFYRTSNLLEVGIKPIFVFDGAPPPFKRATIEARQEIKKEAIKKWEEAVKKGEPAMKYAQAASKLTDEMIEGSKELLDLMGIPWIQAPSEGEAQCAYMCKNNEVFATGSQDSDSLLFGSPKLVRNLSVSGRKKLPKKEVYIEVKPELIELEETLKALGITREQLILAGMLVGTDYNPHGIRGYGPKKSMELIRETKNLQQLLEKIKWTEQIPAETIYNFFMNPPVTDKYKLEWKQPDSEKILKLMVDQHNFSLDRVQRVLQRISERFGKGTQSTLGGWLKK